MHTERTLRTRIQLAAGPLSFFALTVSLAAAPVHAEDIYVAPDGRDDAAGTLAAPFATLDRAQDEVSGGDTVFIRGGDYAFTSGSDANGVLFDKSGTDGAPIRYFAYEDEHPVFDFSGMTAAARITGFRVSASYLYFKGLELKGVPQNLTTEHESWGIYNTGSHNRYELLDTHHNMGPGLFIAKGGDNLVLNCDSHHNYDPKSSSGDGTNADGFGCHAQGGATGNVFRGCRAWVNSDDGFDLIQEQEPVLIEGSWAWSNGFGPDATTPKADGNGFKGGGYGLPATNVPAVPPVHTVRYCVAWSNRSAGFYANHHPVAGVWQHNTAFHNGANFNLLGLDGNVGILRNNLAYNGTLLSNADGVDDESNSWSLSVEVSDDDFESVMPTGVDGPRGADGSLPNVTFMKLSAGSDLIDVGEDLGLPFNDVGPDLGAYESGPPIVEPGSDAGVAQDDGGAASAGTSGAQSGSGGTTGMNGGSGTTGMVSGAGGSTDTTSPQAGSGASMAGGSGAAQTAGQGAGSGGASAPAAGSMTPETARASSCGCRTVGAAPNVRGLALLGMWGLVLGLRVSRRRIRES